MFNHTDRFPLDPFSGKPLPAATASDARPWGLSRMESFPDVDAADDWESVAIDLDPATQVTRYRGPDGAVSMAPGKHRRSNTGTERGTQTLNPGDRRGPTTDQDHSQDHDND